MKIRIADRILVALSGLVTLAVAAEIAVRFFFRAAVYETLTQGVAQWMDANGLLGLVCVAAVVLALTLLGFYCLGMLVRHEKRRRGFVMQQTETGELSISVKAIEGLVQKCLDRHEEVQSVAIALEPGREGLTIRLRMGLTSGVNIPLAVSALQRQIKQYVTSCSGVDVKEVKVQVETATAKGESQAFAVHELPDEVKPLPRVEVETPEKSMAPIGPEDAEAAPEKDRRPLHQRLFGRSEEPVTVMPPPAPKEAEEPEKAEIPADDEASASAEETEAVPAETAEGEDVMETPEVSMEAETTEASAPVPEEDAVTEEEERHEAE